MNVKKPKLYASAKHYLQGPEGMKNEVMMWYVGAAFFLQEVVRKHQRQGFGGLGTAIGPQLRSKLGKIKVLDVCCGPGNFVNYLALVYPHITVIGVDTNEYFLKSARARFGKFGWRFINADVRTLDLGQKFDFVVASSAYHHIPDRSKMHFLRQLTRHLTRNGKVIMCDNFLPAYSTNVDREHSVNKYYSALKLFYKNGNATTAAMRTIEEVHKLELAGSEEHKVDFQRFQNQLIKAGLAIRGDQIIWQPRRFQTSNAGSHVLVLERKP